MTLNSLLQNVVKLNRLGLCHHSGRRCMSSNHFFSKHAITSRSSPRRALLYVPAHEKRFLDKIPSLMVDSIVLDCEDGVSSNRKEDARTNARDYLPQLINKVSGEICVRVNSVGSSFMQDDINCVLGGDILPKTLILPKVQTDEDINAFAHIVDSLIPINKKINVLIMIETAVGLMNIRRILEAGIALSARSNSKFRIEGVIFGSDDFAASIGAERTKESPGMEYARQKIVAYTKAFSMQAIDKVFNEFDDPTTLQKESVEAYKIGFNGKQIIHPDQIDIVQKAFTPKQARITWALELIDAFEAHSKEGRGAFRFRGQMIDMPLLRQAKNIQAINELIDRKNST